jgi:hypothetical protein
MKAVLSLVLLAALTTLAQAQDNTNVNKSDKKPAEPKPAEASSPWSVKTLDKNDGFFGSSSTTVTRDVGDGWSLGGKMTNPYQDSKIGGSGAPGLKQYESPGNSTVFGPVLEKKF